MKTWELQPRPGFDSLTQVERPSPAVGAGEVKVRVEAVSLNYRDLSMARNAPGFAVPRVAASDGAGEVVEVGPGVTRWKVGDRVMASFFPHWVDGELSEARQAGALGGSNGDGMLREEVVLP